MVLPLEGGRVGRCQAFLFARMLLARRTADAPLFHPSRRAGAARDTGNWLSLLVAVIAEDESSQRYLVDIRRSRRPKCRARSS